jgi:sarcosine oxidase subunit alpha
VLKLYEHPILGLNSREKIHFIFECNSYEADHGQTVAGALLANNIFDLGSSKKKLESRGIYCMNGRCCSCFVTINDSEHVVSCMTLIEDGMKIKRNDGPPDIRR